MIHRRYFNWLGGCVKHVKHRFEGGADRYCILSSHKAMTVTMTVDTGTPPVYDGPPSSLFLKLCGDVESNPGPVSYTHLTLPTKVNV